MSINDLCDFNLLLLNVAPNLQPYCSFWTLGRVTFVDFAKWRAVRDCCSNAQM
jgi:hypothetical protein